MLAFTLRLHFTAVTLSTFLFKSSQPLNGAAAPGHCRTVFSKPITKVFRSAEGRAYHSSSFCMRRGRTTGIATPGYFLTRSTTLLPCSPAAIQAGFEVAAELLLKTPDAKSYLLAPEANAGGMTKEPLAWCWGTQPSHAVDRIPAQHNEQPADFHERPQGVTFTHGDGPSSSP